MATAAEVAQQFTADECITIALEDQTQTFVIQKALLCNASEYFAKALAPGFKEGEERRLTLPGSDIEILQLFIYWLCKHDLPSIEHEEQKYARGSQERKAFVTKQQRILVRLWCFGDQFMIAPLQDTAMKRLLRMLQTNFVRIEIVDLAFRLTAPKSVLRTATLKCLMHSYGPKSTPSAYAGPKYSQEDIDHLASTPEVMPQFLSLLSKSRCDKFPCTCGQHCYSILAKDEHEFMIAK